MDLKELVRRYVQQRTVLLVDNHHFEAGKEFAAMRRQPSSEAKTNVVDALDFALKLINEKDAATPTPAANLQRFEPETDGSGEWLIAVMTEDEKGEWVRYSDAMAEIERLRAEVEQLKVGHDRYEILRKLDAMDWCALMIHYGQANNEPLDPLVFDELVDIFAREQDDEQIN